MDAVLGMRALKDLFLFPFRDVKWKTKFLIGSLLLVGSYIIPVLPLLAAYGYVFRLMRKLIDGEALHLPEWEDWGGLMVDGLKLFLVGVVLNLPGVLVMLVSGGFYLASTLAMSFVSSAGNEQASAAALMLMMVAMGIFFLLIPVGAILGIGASFLYLPVSTHVAATGRIGAMFELRRWWAVLRANLGGFILTFFVMAGLAAIMYMAFYLFYMTIILCLFIPVVVAPITMYLMVISAALGGQSYREGCEKLGPPLINQVSSALDTPVSPTGSAVATDETSPA